MIASTDGFLGLRNRHLGTTLAGFLSFPPRWLNDVHAKVQRLVFVIGILIPQSVDMSAVEEDKDDDS
jgi:hypothetical protein